MGIVIRFWKSKLNTRLIVSLSIVFFAFIGTLVLVMSHAATPTASIEAENGTLNVATIVNDATASGNKAVQFGGSSTGVSFGWQLTTSNTGLSGVGVNRNSLPAYNGTISAGQTISNVSITSCLDLTSIPNVTLNRVYLHPSGCNRALILGSGTTIKDSDIDGTSMVQGERIAIYGDVSGSYTITGLSISAVSIGAWLDGTGTGTMTDTYIHDEISIASAHVDGFTRRAGTGALAITRCRIDPGSNSVTGALFLQNTWGDQIGGVAVKDTYLEGDGYVMTLENRGTGTAISVNNVRIRSTGYGPLAATPDSGTTAYPITYIQWTNVFVYSSSATDNAGAVISHP